MKKLIIWAEGLEGGEAIRVSGPFEIAYIAESKSGIRIPINESGYLNNINISVFNILNEQNNICERAINEMDVLEKLK